MNLNSRSEVQSSYWKLCSFNNI